MFCAVSFAESMSRHSTEQSCFDSPTLGEARGDAADCLEK
jgi:hypothetical protein